MIDDLSSIRPYYEAFLKSKGKNLNQKILAQMCEINREGDFGDVFKYLGRTKKDPPTFEQVRKIKTCLEKHWEIRDGKLVAKDPSRLRKRVPVAPVVVAHKNYQQAKVGDAISESEAGEEVCLINTYLATKIMDIETYEDDPDTLKNWLSVQKKQVKILILQPAGKGMFLRTKSNLDQNGAELSNKLIEQLNTLLKLKEEFPGQLHIKMMDEIPGMAAIILKNRLFYGLHYSFGHTEKGTWFEITDPEQDSFKDIKKHFETLWTSETRTEELTSETLEHYKRALNIVRRDLEFLHNSQWKVHLHDLSRVSNGTGAAPFSEITGDILEWKLHISKPEKGIYLKATLEMPECKKTYSANLITENLSDRDYAHARFSDFGDLSVHLSFHCRKITADEPFMLGYFVISAAGDCCAGYAVLGNLSLKTSLDADNKLEQFDPYLRRLLSFRDGSYYSLERIRDDLKRFRRLPYKGKYKVYSYGGIKGGKKCIKQNWLHIDEFGIATYRNQEFDALKGRATFIYPNLHIVFTHFNDGERQRRSYLIISVHRQEAKKDRFYSAVNLGVSTEKDMPIGKRFVLEYLNEQPLIDQENAKIIPLHSIEYERLNPALRGLLSGRIKNLLGFLRTQGHISEEKDLKIEWENSYKMKDVFYDCSLQNARRGKHAKSAEMILRAVNHGFNEMDQFDQVIKEINPEIFAIIQEEDDYKIAKDIFKRKARP